MASLYIRRRMLRIFQGGYRRVHGVSAATQPPMPVTLGASYASLPRSSVRSGSTAPAGSPAASSHSQTQEQQQQKTVTVASFRDLEPLARKFVLRVHPDRIHQYADEHIKTNQRSLAEFMDILEKLRTLSSESTDFSKVKYGEDFAHMKQVYRFQFYFEQKGNNSPSGKHELNQMKYRLLIPSDLLFQTQKSLQQQKNPKNQIKWLALSRRMISDVLRQIGVDLEVELSEEIQEALKEKQYQKERPYSRKKPKEPSAEDLMRSNIQHMSPIVQGKAHGFQDIAMHQLSVFTEQQRNAAVGNYISRRVRTEFIDNEQRAEAVGRLADAMYRYFDALQLFSGTWGIINLVLSASYDFIAETNTVYIPYNFRDREFVDYVKKVLPQVEKEMRKDPQEEVRKQQQMRASGAGSRQRIPKNQSSFLNSVRTMNF
eukprot:gb/GECG01001447.1/.p1 GENE.gb/GECG01001447.1/~~gb/GECG01001447.1/.p1  ORF type:complete len:429 (+),score=61.55 gb/GECG01001447.1/:1-1287(+)